MTVRAASNRPPVTPPEKLRRDDPNGKKLVFEASWDTSQTPPNSKVGMTAVSKMAIEGATTAMIKVFRLFKGERTYIGQPISAPYENQQVKAAWHTTTVNGGDFTGEYHFEVSVGNFVGETHQPLLIRDVAQRFVDDFKPATQTKPKVIF
jgi:hypothetical protein